MRKFSLIIILILVVSIPNAFAVSFEIHAEQYRIGHDITLILYDPDLNRDSDKAESYSLDLITFHFGNDKVSLGPKGDIKAFDPNPSRLRETGDNTGIFYTVIKIPRIVDGKTVKFGEKIAFEYTDFGGFASVFVGASEAKVFSQPTSQKSIQSNVRVAIPGGNSLPGCEKRNSCFIPSELIIFQGQTVTWTNKDSVVHTVTSGNLQKEPDDVGIKFNSAGIEIGEEFSNTFDEVGTFPYFCLRHPRMTGVVIVQSIESETVNPILIPTWIKNNAKWWSEGLIGEDDFVRGIQHLVKEKIIDIPDLPPQASSTAKEKVPDWIKTNAGWWANGQIDEDTFVNGLKYLVEKGIIRV